MDEPVPIRRAAIGCLLLAIFGVVAVVLVRPAIFVFAEPRDDTAVVLGSSQLAANGPVVRDVILARPRGWAGEIDVDDGHAQLRLFVAPSRFGSFTVVAAASPIRDDCPLDIGADRYVDCDGHEWTHEGDPLDPADPPLDRFPVLLDAGNVVVDLTRLDR
jgi:hypothetical protein